MNNMDKIAQIMAMKRMQDELDEMTQRIDGIVQENEVMINDNVDNICARIERELEEICELTDDRISGTKHIHFSAGGFNYGLAFDGTQNKMYFMDTESSWEHKDDKKDYHIVIAKHADASGTHYYEDGRWRDQQTKEIFASDWENAKENIKNAILKAYEYHQKNLVKENMRKLNESENRLASVTKGE